MQINNILITSAGRRVSLVKLFQETLKKFNDNGKVFTTDMNPEMSSACIISDGYLKVPRVTDKNYIQTLLYFSIKNNISIIVPTIDTELHILAEHKTLFEQNNIFVAISSKEICDTFYLKSSTEDYFNKYNFRTPKMIENINNCEYPIFAKMNNSSCSIGAMVVHSLETATELSENNNYIFQELIKGREFTVDLFIDKSGKAISIIPRERLEVRAGEVSKARAIKDLEIINAVRQMSEQLAKNGAYGCITVQLFKNKNNENVFIEINPRFGGGYPLSYYAGSNFAEFLIKDFLGENLEYSDNWRDGTLMLRYDGEVIV